MSLGQANSAIVILVPEAEICVGDFRRHHDPSAGAGMPAHVTLLYPFIAPAALSDGHVDMLKTCLGNFKPFAFSLPEVRRFPSRLLYLAPEPAEPFRDLTMALWRVFPECPPYGGRHPEIVPHLSVAQAASDAELAGIEPAFAAAFRNCGPVRCFADRISLMDDSGGRWKIRQDFLLRG